MTKVIKFLVFACLIFLEDVSAKEAWRIVVPKSTGITQEHLQFPSSWVAGHTHLGADIDASCGDEVFPLFAGEVIHTLPNINTLGFAAMLRHPGKGRGGGDLYTIYLHLQGPPNKSSGWIEANDPIGKVGKTGHPDYGCHTHFEIRNFYKPSTPGGGWYHEQSRSCATGGVNIYACGDQSNASWSLADWENPETYEVEYDPSPAAVDIECHKNAICWKPSSTSKACMNGSLWTKNGAAVTSSVCYEVIEACSWEEGMKYNDTPSDRWWLRKIIDWSVQFWKIEQASAATQECQVQTFSRRVAFDVNGNITTALAYASGLGYGWQTPAPAAPASPPPDFVVKRVWLMDVTGSERYTYSLNESFNTKAQAKNDGSGSCSSGSTITGRFYISKGYKEDPHSGSGAWRRIDSTTTQCSNLGPGTTNTETKNTVIKQWITEPGVYNIVYCIDRTQDDNNGNGQHLERHESNNCSTEAVFTVTRRTPEERKALFRLINQIAND